MSHVAQHKWMEYGSEYPVGNHTYLHHQEENCYMENDFGLKMAVFV